MKKKRDLFWLLLLVPFVPFVFACIVFGSYYFRKGVGLPLAISSTVFDSIRIYSMSISESANTIENLLAGIESPVERQIYHVMLEFARFGGFIFLGAAFHQLFRNSYRRLFTYVRGYSSKNYALHGDTTAVSVLKKQLRGHGLVREGKELFHAKNHIVVFRDFGQTMIFLSENLSKMLKDDHRVYVYTGEDIQSEHLNRRLIITNCAKNCARLYWEKEYLRASERKVVLIGFGRYGEELLNHALCNYVFTENRSIEYHVFGEGERYLAQHPMLGQFLSLNESSPERDSLHFHSEAWYGQTELLNEADRVILCADTDLENLAVMNEMRSAGLRPEGKNDIRLSDPKLLDEIWQFDHEQFRPFGSDSELFTLGRATGSELYAKGRIVHAYYYGTTRNRSPRECLNDEEFQREWENTSHYNRSSSIAQDDHSAIKVRALLGDDVPLTEASARRAAEHYMELTDAEKLPYLEMEHRRWCRFLWMNGWSYAPVRDNAKRHHHFLVPFEDLPEGEARKDENAYIILKDAGMEEERES